MVSATAVGKDAEELLHSLGCFPAEVRVKNNEANGASPSGGDAGGGALSVGEKGSEVAMNLTGVGSALALLVLKSVEFGEHVGWEADVVVCKAVDAAGVVQQDVGVEDEVFSVFGGGNESEFASFGLGQARRVGAGGEIACGRGFIKELDLRSVSGLHKWFFRTRVKV